MAEEQVYSVSGSSAVAGERVTLSELRLMERDHLQEWVLAHPQILGEEALVVTFEFDKWLTGAGTPTWERLDVLALDQTGRLIVAELKRDRAPDSVVVQALNYAAMASRFTVDLLVEAYLDRHRDLDGSADAALMALQGWAPNLSDETLGPPKIVLVAEGFGPVVTNTAMYLIEQGLEVRLIRIQLYRLAADVLALTASQLLPVPASEEFMVRPRSAVQTQRATAARRTSIPERLAASDLLRDGEPLRIVVPAGVGEQRDRITEWLAGGPTRSQVLWRKDPRAPVTWLHDSAAWNLTTLIRHVIEEATGEPPRTQVWGPNWFRDGDGVVLHKLAEQLPDDGTAANRFDWARLHGLLSQLPPGRWTTYGDLAAIVGTAPQPLGNHMASCADCPNAWRVLGADGRSRPNFRRSDPADLRPQAEILASEGVCFTSDVADALKRLPSASLQTLDS